MQASFEGASAGGHRTTIRHRWFLWLTFLRKSSDQLRLQRGWTMQASFEGASAGGHRTTIRHRWFLWLTFLRKSSDQLRLWWSGQLFPAQGPGARSCGGWFWAGFALLAIVAGSLLFLNLSYPLLEPDEGRYAEVVREMLT